MGGTGFYFDKAPDLPYEIEHHMPDYHLYDSWIESEIEKAKLISENCDKAFDIKKFKIQFKEYLDYSIGFVTRGCFRKCGFCVNKKVDGVALNTRFYLKFGQSLSLFVTDGTLTVTNAGLSKTIK